MGIFRGGLLIILAVALFVTLLLANIFYVMSLSLGYENVQEEFSPFVSDLSNGTFDETLSIDEFSLIEFDLGKKTDEALDSMEDYCVDYEEYVFVSEGYVVTLSCSSFEEGEDVVVEEAVEGFVESAYYYDYGCGFWSCLKEKSLPFFLVSENARDYWQNKFYFSLMVLLVLAVLVFFLVEQKQNAPIFLGSFLIISSLPLLKLANFVESVTGRVFAPFIRVFFSRADFVFWIVFVLGLILLLLGIGLRLWQSDMIKKKFSSTDVRKIVKSEIDKYKKGKKKSDLKSESVQKSSGKDKTEKSVLNKNTGKNKNSSKS
ncbi:MAG: hypothetical protein WDZ69_01920 [Candidatus Pacearchaeota archaeon]